MDELGSRIFSAGKDWLFASVGSWLHWLIGLVMQTIGWPGIVALAAACLLLLSLSARAVRFIHSAKGMAATAAIALVAGGLTWWTWPAPALAEPAAMLASASPPAAELVEMAPKPVIAAVKAPEPPPVERIAAKPAARAVLPPLPFIAVAAPVVLQPPPLPPAPHVAPIVVATPAHVAPHHVNKPSHHTFGQTRASSAAVVGHPITRGGFASSGFGHGFSPAASHHRPTIHDFNNAAMHGQGPFAGPMMGMGGFAHPMHMGGVHPGMVHGVHHGHH